MRKDNWPKPLTSTTRLDYPPVPEGDPDWMRPRRRKMGKAALEVELETMLHYCGHFPHNPYCETCRIAPLQQQRFKRKVPAGRSDMPYPTKPGQITSADTMIISRSKATEEQNASKASADGHVYAFALHDAYSGQGCMFPQDSRNTAKNDAAFKHFRGRELEGDVNCILKSDCAPEILGAIKNLKCFQTRAWPIVGRTTPRKRDGFAQSSPSNARVCCSQASRLASGTGQCYMPRSSFRSRSMLQFSRWIATPMGR